MSKSSALSQRQLDGYRDRLRETHRRMSGEVDNVVEAVREETNPGGNLSNAPVHMGDAASDRLEADINVIETETAMLDEIDEALRRIEEGTYGVCSECGDAIRRERLDVIPYAKHCIACAEKLNK